MKTRLDGAAHHKPSLSPASRQESHQGRSATGPRQLQQRQQIAQLQQSAPEVNRTGLPDALKSGIEALSGMDMSSVRVHRSSSKPAALQAHAYAQGSEIHLGPGQEQHLPHEAWHVIQQAQGRVRPTLQIPGGASVNDNASLELEADLMGARAAANPVQRARKDHGQDRRPGSSSPDLSGRQTLATAVPTHPSMLYGDASVPSHDGVHPTAQLTIALAGPVIQRVGLLATMSTLATYAAWNTMMGTPLGLLAAYLVLRQGYESYTYHTGLSETDRNKVEESSCTVHVIRTQKLSRWGDSYQDDHISLGVKINGDWAKKVGFWMDRSDYKEFPSLAIRNTGEVRDDSKKFEGFTNVDMSGEEVIPVSHEQAASIVERIEADEKKPPKFSATGYGGYTCITWAHEVLSSNGVTLELRNKVLPPFPESLIPDSKMKEKSKID